MLMSTLVTWAKWGWAKPHAFGSKNADRIQQNVPSALLARFHFMKSKI